MGMIVHGKCPRCGYYADVPVGGGLLDCEQETALSAARGDPGLKAALKDNGQFRIERFPTICISCHQMRAGVQVTYWTPDGETHVVPAACPDCGGHVKKSSGDIIPCPKCGHPLDLTSVGHWD